MAEIESENSSVNDEKSAMDASASQDDAMGAPDDHPPTSQEENSEINSGSLTNGASKAYTDTPTLPLSAVAAESTIMGVDTIDTDVTASETKNRSVNKTEPATKSDNLALEPTAAPVQFKMPSVGPRKPSASVKAALSDIPDTGDSSSSDKTNAKDPKKATDESSEAKLNQLSAAEKLKQSTLAAPYKEPEWGGLCTQKYSFEIVKSGAVIDTYDLTSKSLHVVGRLPTCDHCMEHPSLSRHHAVLQYCAVANDRHRIGWYLYDLDSTHGTTVNKYQVKGRVFTALKVGYIIKFAGSTRLHILQGPDEDQDEESSLSIAELKAEAAQRIAEKEAGEKVVEGEGKEGGEQKEGESGCSWGITEDAAPDMEQNPFTLGEVKNEKLYLDDPKKALKGFFEREGYDLPEYEFVDSSCGKHTCRVELPVDLLSGTTGEPLYGEASVQGKKKDAVIACALDACRILDKHDVLRRSKHESRAKKKKNWKQEDFYDSDDDEFLDRTGDIERKRKMRMKMFGHKKEQAATYESLLPQLEEVEKEIAELELKLQKAKSETESLEAQGMDALDAYMTAIKAGTMDTKTRMAIKRSLVDLRREQQRLSAMVKVARPVHLPSLQKLPVQPDKPKALSMPMFGKMKGHGKAAPAGRPLVPHEEDVGKIDEEEEMKVEEDSEEEEEEEENIAKEEKSIENENKNVEEKVKKNVKEKVKMSDKVQVESVEEEEKSTEEKKNAESEMEKSPPKKEDALLPENEGNSETIKSVSQKAKKKRKMSGPKMIKEEDTTDLEEPEKKARKKAAELLTSKEYCDDDPDYATWIPPQGQSGDGKTHLNAKYGY